MLQPAQVCDILKGVILIMCYFMMHYVDYSMMYHLIRGQSVIKLYIIYNMLEVRPFAACGLAGTQDFKSSSVEGVGRRMLAVASGKGASFTRGSWELSFYGGDT